jgi:DnaJ homolog subfamily A member 5
VDKENKRLRDEGVRDFNDAVRSLVAFVRRRDPRFIPNSQSEADRQKILREAAAAQAARSRAANQAKLKEHIIPAWAQTHQVEADDHFTESEESEVEHVECVVCGKVFKSEKQYETHEKSKKHIKAVQQLRREMRKENERLNLDTPPNGQIGNPSSGLNSLDHQEEAHNQDSTPPYNHSRNDPPENGIPGQKDESITADTISELKPELQDESLSDLSEMNDEYASRKDVEIRLVGSLADGLSLESLDDSTAAASVASDGDGVQKLGKAKLKRAKKKARQEQASMLVSRSGQASNNPEFTCGACKELFTSKTKLFAHIKELNHAQAMAVAGTKAGKKKH